MKENEIAAIVMTVLLVISLVCFIAHLIMESSNNRRRWRDYRSLKESLLEGLVDSKMTHEKAVATADKINSQYYDLHCLYVAKCHAMGGRFGSLMSPNQMAEEIGRRESAEKRKNMRRHIWRYS